MLGTGQALAQALSSASGTFREPYRLVLVRTCMSEGKKTYNGGGDEEADHY